MDARATLAVGIVIDDAIIVLENIVRTWRRRASDGERRPSKARRNRMAVTATTLSLRHYIPAGSFHDGYARRFVNELAWNMALSIMVSLS